MWWDNRVVDVVDVVGWSAKGHLIKRRSNRRRPITRPAPQMASWLPHPAGDGFDWQGDAPLGLKMEDLVIYEMHVRGFTEHPSRWGRGPIR
jgi:pullulanase/glycogen debranching enzyme